MILLFLSAGKVLASYADVLLARHAIFPLSYCVTSNHSSTINHITEPKVIRIGSDTNFLSFGFSSDWCVLCSI